MDVILALFIYTLVFLFVVISVLLSRQLSSPNVKILDFFFSILHKIIPNCLYDCISDGLEFCLYTRNPILQILYIALLFVGYTSYFLTTYQYVSESIFGNLPFLLLSMNLVLFYVCSTIDAGVVTQENVQKYTACFAYDGVLYREGRNCQTCLQVKPARSKHCAICDVCVSRFDHHCGWVNNCIGQHNYKFFLLYLLTLVVITFVSGGLTLLVFVNIVDERRLYSSMYVDSEGNRFEADFNTVVTFLLAEYPMMGFLLLYLSLLSIALLLFFAYHVFIVVTNRTTNEICRRKCADSAEKESTEAEQRENTATTNKKLKRRRRVKNEKEKKGNRIKEHGSKVNFFGIYSKGIVKNVMEVILG